MVRINLVAVCRIAEVAERGSQGPQEAHQHVLVRRAPRALHRQKLELERRHRFGRQTQPAVARRGGEQILRLRKRHAVAFAGLEQSNRTGVPTSSLTR